MLLAGLPIQEARKNYQAAANSGRLLLFRVHPLFRRSDSESAFNLMEGPDLIGSGKG